MNAQRDLERRIHRVLSGLPTPRAPRTLLPRVLTAVARRWYERAWLTWPRPAQVASVAALVVVVAGVASLGAASEGLDTASTLVRIGWRNLLEPAAGYLLTLSVALVLALGISWTIVSRVALGGLPE